MSSYNYRCSKCSPQTTILKQHKETAEQSSTQCSGNQLESKLGTRVDLHLPIDRIPNLSYNEQTHSDSCSQSSTNSASDTQYWSNPVDDWFQSCGSSTNVGSQYNRQLLDSWSHNSGKASYSKGHICSPQPAVRWTKKYQNQWSVVKRSFLLTLALLSILHIDVGQAKIRSMDPGDPVGNIRHVLPELDLGNNSTTDVRFNIGSTAFLPCRFPSFPRHHENRVSWVRRWDWHILTAGLFTYTNDDRFVVLHKDGSNDWTLQIKFLNMQDNGTYECQVHSGSGFMSQFVNLHVVIPRAVILEPRELTVKNGDNFALTCIIQQSLEPPVYVMWLHGGVPVNYAPDRPRLNVEMEAKGSSSRSLLKVKDAKYTDSGNYTCTAPNAVIAWVLVYITEGDTVAAVQRRHPDASSGTSSSASSSSGVSPSSSGTNSGGASSPVTPSSASCLSQKTFVGLAAYAKFLLCAVFAYVCHVSVASSSISELFIVHHQNNVNAIQSVSNSHDDQEEKVPNSTSHSNIIANDIVFRDKINQNRINIVTVCKPNHTMR